MKSLKEALIHKHMDLGVSLKMGDVVRIRDGRNAVFIDGPNYKVNIHPKGVLICAETWDIYDIRAWDKKTLKCNSRLDITHVFSISDQSDYIQEIKDALKEWSGLKIKNYINRVVKEIRAIKVN